MLTFRNKFQVDSTSRHKLSHAHRAIERVSIRPNGQFRDGSPECRRSHAKNLCRCGTRTHAYVRDEIRGINRETLKGRRSESTQRMRLSSASGQAEIARNCMCTIFCANGYYLVAFASDPYGDDSSPHQINTSHSTRPLGTHLLCAMAMLHPDSEIRPRPLGDMRDAAIRCREQSPGKVSLSCVHSWALVAKVA